MRGRAVYQDIDHQGRQWAWFPMESGFYVGELEGRVVFRAIRQGKHKWELWRVGQADDVPARESFTLAQLRAAVVYGRVGE